MAVNHELAQLALQTRLATLEVCTTGVQTLSATATGYARTAGSFLTDGFVPGMEVTPTGFTQTARGVVEAVTALALTIGGGRQVEAAAGGRTIATKLPELRAWENLGFKPVPERPYIGADYVPATAQLLSVPAAGGTVEETGLFVTRFYVKENTGVLALARYAKATLALYLPGTTIALSDGSAVRIRENPGPWRGQIRPADPGWALVVITVPWRIYTLN